LVSISVQDDLVLVIPHTEKGKLNLQLLTKGKSHIIKAHENGIQTFCLNLDGTKLATASEKGTLIRIWDVEKGSKIKELRRGKDPAVIYSIAFSKDSKFLCCSSDKGTIHIFNIQEEDEEEDNKKK